MENDRIGANSLKIDKSLPINYPPNCSCDHKNKLIESIRKMEMEQSFTDKNETEFTPKKELSDLPTIIIDDPLIIETKEEAEIRKTNSKKWLEDLQNLYKKTDESSTVWFGDKDLGKSLLDSFDRDKRSPKNAWAPGTYLSTCCICGETFMGDKRAVNCAPCAYKEN